jgi:hypothetical protein
VDLVAKRSVYHSLDLRLTDMETCAIHWDRDCGVPTQGWEVRLHVGSGWSWRDLEHKERAV